MGRLLAGVAAFVLWLATAPSAFAHNAQITGTVKDSSGGINGFRTQRNVTPVSEVDCPGFANIDLRFSKFFRIGGSVRAEFIAQLFNIFDRANFATPNNNIGCDNDATGRPLFGTSTSLLANINAPSRQAEFAVRPQF